MAFTEAFTGGRIVTLESVIFTLFQKGPGSLFFENKQPEKRYAFSIRFFDTLLGYAFKLCFLAPVRFVYGALETVVFLLKTFQYPSTHPSPTNIFYADNLTNIVDNFLKP